jgi:hypothetical protein
MSTALNARPISVILQGMKKEQERPMFSMVFRDDLEVKAMLDEWRRSQPDLPSRAEALRRLVRQALSVAGGKAK